MKLFVQSPDSKGRIDGTLHNQILRHLPVSDNPEDADAVVIPLTWMPDFSFNNKLRDITKPIILLDYLEFGWDYDFDKCNLIWHPEFAQGMYSSQEWGGLNAWCKNHFIDLTFKRELRQQDVSDRILPAEWLNYLPEYPIDTEQEFNARPIEVFYNWGYSHPQRVKLHAQIFEAMATHNIGVISNWSQIERYFEHKTPRTWLSIYSPWYDRQPIENVIKWQSRSKLSLSMPGAGIKCFRHAETVNTILCAPIDDLAWSYPWDHCINSLRMNPGCNFSLPEVSCREHSKQLYRIYVRGQENMNNYRPKNYIPNHILKNIERVL